MNRKRIVKGLTQDIRVKKELKEQEYKDEAQLKKEKKEALFWSKTSLPGSQNSLTQLQKKETLSSKKPSKSLFVSGQIPTYEETGLPRGPLRELNSGKQVYKEHKEYSGYPPIT